ncbi:relaxin family peptide receptor 2 [Mytilus galloprovincialis]|uniref:Relaxin family peptide receptor 2 n=1 Tax=Mytilus galloprovincialis TaxID=29158 RepID=A0A8B6CDZ1_MYTGA|nr:relaxin family peptide receptor 2 [Mytilus galloprovincialis]
MYGITLTGIKPPPIWPTGSYALPASMYGCPEGDWDTRYINLTLPLSSNDVFYWESSGTDYMEGYGNKIFHIRHSKDLYILGPYSKRSVQLNFCVQDGNDPSRLQEAQGNFCMYDIGKGCAKGSQNSPWLSNSYSLGRPVYSSPYVKSPTNNPFFVVDEVDQPGEVFSTELTYRPWIQIDLQQFIVVTHAIKRDVRPPKVPPRDLYGMYVSKNQWDFVNRGARACFFGLTENEFHCRRLITGQFVTLTLEYEQDHKLYALTDLKVFGRPTGCGRSLGMISGDIKDYQIETSSNYKDIHHSRAMQATEGWCSSPEDMERWLMVDLIVPTEVQGVILHGWYQMKRRFINSFVVEFGLQQHNLKLYVEDGRDPKQRTIDKGYIGNIYQGTNVPHCCYYNTSSTNRHYTHLWKREDNKDVLSSERLCFSDFYRPSFNDAGGMMFPPLHGYTDYIDSPMFPSNYPKGITEHLTIWSFPGKYLKLTILYASFAQTATEAQLSESGHSYINPSSCKDTLSIDMGTGKKIKISNDNQNRYRYASFMATGDNVNIYFTSCFQYLMADNLMYQLKIENIDYPGCGVNASRFATCTEKTAYIASHLYPSLYTASDTNMWKIRGRYGQYIELQFIELDVNIFKLVDAFVEVFDFDIVGERSESLGRFTKATKPHFRLVSSWHMMDVEFRVGNDLTGRGFLGLYTIKDNVIDTISNDSENDDGIRAISSTGSSFSNRSMFTCENGEVISQFAVCDSYHDCFDISDEKYCGSDCLNSQFQCADGSCIHLTFYCDHTKHCKDGSDEHHCQWKSCGDGEWQCDNKQCIPLEERCDVTIDCLDGSDENNCDKYLVYCEFNEEINTVLVSTSFHYNSVYTAKSHIGIFKTESNTFHFPVDMIKDAMRNNDQGCSQNVKLICYYQDALDSDADAVVESCHDGCNCIGGFDWKQADINKVFTDDIEISNHDRLPFNDYIIQEISYSDEGFSDVTVGPVVCKSEISKNVSRSQSLCSDGKLYNYTDHCIMRVNERSDVNGCRDMTHLQHCARKLDLSSSVFPNNNLVLPAYTYLAELILLNCSIENITPYSFEKLMNLLHLDLSNNKFKVLQNYTFYGLTKLVTLNLKDNLLLGLIKSNAFMSLPNVKDLELSGTRIQTLFNGTFNGLENLEQFNITGNGLTTVEENVFDGLVSLLKIDLTQNDVTEFSPDIFSRLFHLTKMKTDSYIFCCLKPESVSAENCFPKMDEFSSCTDLMRNDILRVFLWIIAINALIGNIGVILYRIINEKTLLFKANGLFIMNLGVSDMLMGVYLGIIAVADMYYSGNYILHDREWRDSLVCKFAGILAAISCEASVNFIMLTTLECYLMVKFPFGRMRMTYKTAKILTFLCWVFVIIIAVIPIYYTSYFSNMFYSKTAVCLALPFSRQKVSGWEYSTAIFVFYNSIAFTVIAWCQLSIYNVAKSSNRIMAKRTKQDLTLARRLFLVVLTDFLCWFPVGIMGILAMTGQVFPSEIYSWVAVCVMPLNAALNPFLYTFSTLKQKPSILGKMFGKIFQVSKVQDRLKDTSDEMFMASAFINNSQMLKMKHITLRELFASRNLTIRESIRLVSQLAAAVAYLHHHYLTVCQPLSLDTLAVFMDRETIIRMKVISEIKDIRNELDTAQDVDNIGQITKLVIKNTRKLQEDGNV